MFSKSFAASILLLVLTSSVNADIVFGPALGVSGAPAQSNVQRPPSGQPCGGVPISENVKNATCAKADANGNFPVTAHNFGSAASSIKSMQVDTTGNGDKFVQASVPKNGAIGSEGGDITAQLPSGTECSGGADGHSCLVSFIASDNTGNCVMVSQPGGATKSSIPPVPSHTPAANPNGQQGGNGKVNGDDDNEHDSATNKGNTNGAGNTVNASHKRHGDEPPKHHKVHKVVKPKPANGGRTWGSR